MGDQRKFPTPGWILWFDAHMPAPDGFHWAKTVPDLVELLRMFGRPDYMSLGSGSVEAVNTLRGVSSRPPRYRVHAPYAPEVVQALEQWSLED